MVLSVDSIAVLFFLGGSCGIRFVVCLCVGNGRNYERTNNMVGGVMELLVPTRPNLANEGYPPKGFKSVVGIPYRRNQYFEKYE